jgi:hypothetical protein
MPTNWDDYSLLTTLADGDTFLVHDVSETTVGQKMKRIATAYARATLKGSAGIGTTRYNQLFLVSGKDIKPALTNGCAASAQIEMGTNKNVYDYLAFDASTNENSYSNIILPSDYSGGSVYFKFYWTHPATTVNFTVRWAFSAVSINNDESLDVNLYASASGINDTGGTTSKLYISDITELVISGTPAANELFQFAAFRAATNAADTLAVDAYLLGVMIYYPIG